MRGRVLIVDPVAPAPYSDAVLASRALGGTEATVVRVAHALAELRPVTVLQRAREHGRRAGGVEYGPYRHGAHRPRGDVEAVIVVRAHKVLRRLRHLYPRARMFLWMHCFPGRRLRPLARAANQARATVVAVSDFHRRWMSRFFQRHDPAAARRLDVTRVYNPLGDDIRPDGRRWDPDKLLFLSSPHKGLDQVFDAFRQLRRRIPSLRLHVANPGYLERRFPDDLEGVEALGKLPHAQVLDHLRDSLCLFYPQSTFLETFGLVFAEANAVGTPVLAHPLGAAPEVIGDDEQLCDTRDLESVYRRIARWRSGARPRPFIRNALRLSSVMQDWNRLLSTPYPATKGACGAPERAAASPARL